MLTRRELVVAGGLALAGRLLPSSPWAQRETKPTVEIAMRASGDGARVWFDPLGLLVRPGTAVRWVLVDGVHTTTAYHPANGDLPRRIPEGARPWDSGYLVEPGATYEVTLDVPGVYDFFCRPHEAAGMVGRIVVDPTSDAAHGVITPTAGDTRLPAAALAGLPRVEDILRRESICADDDNR